MHTNEILAALALPETFVKDRWVDKRTLVRESILPGYRERILEQIASVRWLATIGHSPDLFGHIGPERDNTEISINVVTTRPGCDYPSLAEALHSAIPNPAVIFFAQDDKITVVSVAIKTWHNGLRWDHLLADGVNLCQVPADPAHECHAPFFGSLRWDQLPKEDLSGLYDAWYARVTALRVYWLTKEYRVATSLAESARRRHLLSEHARLDHSRQWHRKMLKDIYSPNERSEVDQKIAALDQSIEKIKAALRVQPDALDADKASAVNADGPSWPVPFDPHAIDKYRLNGGNDCLFCQARSVVRSWQRDRPILVCGFLHLDVHCERCGARWVDGMRLETVSRPLPESP